MVVGGMGVAPHQRTTRAPGTCRAPTSPPSCRSKRLKLDRLRRTASCPCRHASEPLNQGRLDRHAANEGHSSAQQWGPTSPFASTAHDRRFHCQNPVPSDPRRQRRDLPRSHLDLASRRCWTWIKEMGNGELFCRGQPLNRRVETSVMGGGGRGAGWD